MDEFRKMIFSFTIGVPFEIDILRGGGAVGTPFSPEIFIPALRYERCRFEGSKFEPECHRRRINKKVKAKVIAAVWGTEFIKLFAVLCSYSILPRGRNVKNRMNSSSSFKSFWCNSSYMIQIVQYKRNWINSFPPNRSDDLCLFFYLYPSSMQEGSYLFLLPALTLAFHLRIPCRAFYRWQSGSWPLPGGLT